MELRADVGANEILHATPAGEKDFDTEFLDYILAVKVVDSVEEAIGHIAEHSTGHSDGIVTEDPETAKLFTCLCRQCRQCMINVSTRFTDGGEFGLGCEMGHFTQKHSCSRPHGTGGALHLQVHHPRKRTDPLK